MLLLAPLLPASLPPDLPCQSQQQRLTPACGCGACHHLILELHCLLQQQQQQLQASRCFLLGRLMAVHTECARRCCLGWLHIHPAGLLLGRGVSAGQFAAPPGGASHLSRQCKTCGGHNLVHLWQQHNIMSRHTRALEDDRHIGLYQRNERKAIIGGSFNMAGKTLAALNPAAVATNKGSCSARPMDMGHGTDFQVCTSALTRTCPWLRPYHDSVHTLKALHWQAIATHFPHMVMQRKNVVHNVLGVRHGPCRLQVLQTTPPAAIVSPR